METQITIPPTVALAERINATHRTAEQFRDSAVSSAGMACRSAVECGILLEKAKEENPREFGLWLETNCPEIHERTAQRYMVCARKYATALSDGSLDFQ